MKKTLLSLLILSPIGQALSQEEAGQVPQKPQSAQPSSVVVSVNASQSEQSSSNSPDLKNNQNLKSDQDVALNDKVAPTNHSAKFWLEKMSDASQHLSYELSYILVQKSSIEPLVYRHTYLNKKNISHLVYLSGPLREVIRLGNTVSYIEPGDQPLSIQSKHMVAPVIPLLNTNIDKLSHLYDFVHLGRAREAGASCQVIRVVPKDGKRYSYIVWIDERSKLPLRADLIERNGEILEQYRTISFSINNQIGDLLQQLTKVKLPQVVALPKTEPKASNWDITWVPDGFESGPMSRYRIETTQRMVESKVYTDGLFYFSVYVADIDEKDGTSSLYRQGRRTLRTYVKSDKEISVIGDIPPATAKKIAESVEFSDTNS